MKKILKRCMAIALACCMLFALYMPPASAFSWTDAKISVVKNSSYFEGTKYCANFTIKTGRYPGSYSNSDKTKVKLVLYNSSGSVVATWDEKSYSPNTTVTREPSYNFDGKPSGTYTLKVTLTVVGEVYEYISYVVNSQSFTWSFNISWTQPSTISLSKVEVVRRDDGTYANKFYFAHSGAKGQMINMEIYDEWGNRKYSTQGGPIGYTSGTYSIQWGGYPSSGGLQCNSGNYTIKYWLGGKSAKQSKQYLSIY